MSLPHLSTEYTTSKKYKCIRYIVPLFTLFLFGGVITIIITNITKNNNFEIDDYNCPPTSKRIVAFWQSEVDGCDKIPEGITHIVFGFSVVNNDGVAELNFQNSDKYIKSCIKKLKKKCIKVMGSIGGANNNNELAKMSDINKFVSSIIKLVDKFKLDGIDIDDEVVGEQFNKLKIIQYIKLLREQKPNLELSYDAYFYEGVSSRCSHPDYSNHSRCFPQEILEYVNWINIMAYNIELDPIKAEHIYSSAIDTVFLEWEKQLKGDFSKATIGICTPKSCAYGIGPNDQIINSWIEFAKTRGGMMVYAISSEVNENFPIIRNIINRM